MGAGRETGCDSKTGFDSWRRADEVRKKMLRRGDRGLDIYHCRFCSAFHIGHQPVWRRKQADSERRNRALWAAEGV